MTNPLTAKPIAYRCVHCGCLWRLNAAFPSMLRETWSLYDEHQKPQPCCDNCEMEVAVLQ